MPEKTYSRLSLQQRLSIQKGITEEKGWRAIALDIGVSPTTVSREVLRNRVRDRSARYGKGVRRFCANEKDCEVKGLCLGCTTRLCRVCRKCLCTTKCPHYKEAQCRHLSGPPYVCGGCTKKAVCRAERWIYDAPTAHQMAEARLVEARAGFDIDLEEAREIESWLAPLVHNGQTPEQIYLHHKDELPFSIRTLYTYIASGLFPQISNFDLHRKVRYKIRAKKRVSIPRDFSDRDYDAYMKLSPEKRAQTTECDSVIGRVGGAAFMTMYMRTCQLMPIFWMESCCQEAVEWVYNDIYSALVANDLEMGEVFPVLLADRGSEQTCWDRVERLYEEESGEETVHLYYCDRASPGQRGAQEGSHTYIREILPTGTSFDSLAPEDVRKLASHINSIPRPSLGGRSPYEVASFLYGESFVRDLGISYVPRDEVIRRRWLLDK